MEKVLTFGVTKGKNGKLRQITNSTFCISWHRKGAPGELQNEESAHIPCYKRQKLKNHANFDLHFLTQKVSTWHITKRGKCSLSVLQKGRNWKKSHFYALHILHFMTQKGTWRITNGESVHIPHFITQKVFSAAKSGGGDFKSSVSCTYQNLSNDANCLTI